MLHNYLTVAWRCLVRDGTTSVVNVAGLTLAIACALLAALFIRHELTYDQFHENGDRIFRFGLARTDGYTSPRLPPNASSAMRDAFPEIEGIARVQEDFHTDARVEDAERVELDALLVDPDFLRMFSYPEMAGRGPEALTDPQSVVLTESAARRLFDGEALGRTVTLRVNQLGGEPRDMIVGAVLEDPPAASSLRFECLIGLRPERAGEPIPDKRFGGDLAYVQLAQRARPEDLEVKLTSWLSERWVVARRIEMLVRLQPLRDIHFNSNIQDGFSPTSRLLYSYMLAGIALAVVCIACINYSNTAVARSLARSGEIGVRKVLGAARGQLARQFASEAVLATAASFILALGLAQLLLPAFAQVAQRDLELSDLWSWSGAIATLSVFAVASAGAAAYPAVILSRVRQWLHSIESSGQPAVGSFNVDSSSRSSLSPPGWSPPPSS